MNRFLLLLSAILLAACTTTPTPTTQTAVIGTVETLAAVAAKYNTTAAELVAQGSLICGKVNSVSGALIENTVEAVATVAGIPASVVDAAANDVAAACPAGLSPGPLPPAMAAAQVPLVETENAVVLPAVLPTQ